jgi:hypothetical protein
MIRACIIHERREMHTVFFWENVKDMGYLGDLDEVLA